MHEKSVDTLRAEGCAVIIWHWRDVQNLRRSWSEERCKQELARASKVLVARSIELGWDVLETLLPVERK